MHENAPFSRFYLHFIGTTVSLRRADFPCLPALAMARDRHRSPLTQRARNSQTRSNQPGANHENEKTSLSSFQKFTGDDIKFSHVRAVEIIDLRISYHKGAPIAYIRPLTTHGCHWLWDHVKYPYAGSNAIVDAEQLLELIQRMDADELTIHWQS